MTTLEKQVIIPEPYAQSDHCRVWFGLSEEIYRHELEGISQSTLKYGLKSAAHLHQQIVGPGLTETPAMLKGTVAHAMVLQPSISGMYEPEPEGFSGTKKADKELKQEKADAGIQLVKPDLYEDAINIARAIEDHPIASELLGEYDGTEDWELWSEVSLQWNHFASRQITLKGRIDRLVSTPGHLSLVDLKTTKDLGSWMRRAKWEAPDFFFQAALYLQAIHEAKPLLDHVGSTTTWHWIVVESTPPYDIKCLKLTDAPHDCGNRAIAECVELLRRCRETNQWPGSAPDVYDFDDLHPAAFNVPKLT